MLELWESSKGYSLIIGASLCVLLSPRYKRSLRIQAQCLNSRLHELLNYPHFETARTRNCFWH